MGGLEPPYLYTLCSRRNARVTRVLLLSLLFSVLGVLAVLFLLGGPEDLAALNTIPLWAFGGGVGGLALNHLCGALRLSLLTRTLGTPLGLWRAWHAYLLGRFSAAVTPSGSGAVPAVALYLTRRGLTSGQAWSVPLYTSVLDLFFFSLSAPLAIFLVVSALPNAPVSPLLALPLAALFLGMGYGLAFHLGALTRPVFWLFSWRPLRRGRRATLRALRRASGALEVMRRGGLLRGLLLGGLTALIHGASYGIFVLFARSLEIHTPPLFTLAVVLLSSVASFAVPTPGGSGALEVMVGLAIGRSADASSATATVTASVTAAVIAWRLTSHYSNVVLGAVFGGPLFGRLLTSKMPEEPPAPAP